jgi:hypothetical protein
MQMLDLISAAYVAYGAWRGRARGLAEEGYRLFRMAVAFAAGCGLYGLISKLLAGLLSVGGDVSGPIGFVSVMGGSWYALRVLKAKLTAFLSSRFAAQARIGGLVAGGLRTLIIVLSIAGVLNLAGREDVSERSVVSRVAAWVMP